MRPVIAYPGTAGSFSCQAAQEAFPEGDCVGYATFPEAVESVLHTQADYALLPVENSSAGAVLTTYTLLEKLPVHIVGEVTKAVRHQLLAPPGATLESIRQIDSHPQAIAQCDEFLQGLPGVRLIPSANTAISAREVAESGDVTRAAIASLEAAKEYGLVVLKENIQSSQNNTTRFVILSKHAVPLGTPDKASIIFTVNNEIGALAKVLTTFADFGLNMSRIESRPLPDTTFVYFFIADFEGSMDAAHLSRAMEQARPHVRELRLLGVYPRAGRKD